MKTETLDLNFIAQTIEPLRQQLLEHPLYHDLRTIEDLREFMEHHVFAVWDFMSLLKALQRELTCVRVPWLPVGNPAVRALVNEIVLGEESDTDPDGRPASHYELYLEAMQEAGAQTGIVENFVAQLPRGTDVPTALALSGAPTSVQHFVAETFRFIEAGDVHETAAAFTYGREDLIPGIFGEIVGGLEASVPGRLGKFRYYLDRHIELDGGEHGELGRQMVASLCGDDPVKWEQAATAAARALQSRVQLWDAIHAAITARRA